MSYRIQVDPDASVLLRTLSPHVVLGIGRTLAELAEAADTIRRAVELEPDSAEYLYFRGLIYEQGQQVQDAVDSFQKSIAKNPKNADAYEHLGQNLNVQNRFLEAVAAFKKAGELDPSRVAPPLADIADSRQPGHADRWPVGSLDQRHSALGGRLQLVGRKIVHQTYDQRLRDARELRHFVPQRVLLEHRPALAVRCAGDDHLNPADHPHGGGEGRAPIGGQPQTPWGKPTLGHRTRGKKPSDKFIVRRRKSGR